MDYFGLKVTFKITPKPLCHSGKEQKKFILLFSINYGQQTQIEHIH